MREDLEKRRDENTVCFSGIIAGERTEFGGLPVIDATWDIGALVDLIEAKATEYTPGRRGGMNAG